MAVNDFTGKNIQDTYQRVIQTDGVNLADGTGSALPIKFDGPDLIVSGALRAQSYILSESVVNVSSGSTVFGDSSDDSHTFNGNITASGDISASGTSHILGGDLTIDDLFLGEGRHSIDSHGSNTLTISSGSTILMQFAPDGATTITGNITASGNISASGDIHVGSSIIGGGTRIYPDNALSSDHYIGKTSISNPMIQTAGGLKVTGNITSSGTISASGMIQTAGAISSSTGITASAALFSGNITGSGTLKVAGNIHANGNIIGDDTTDITNISNINCDTINDDATQGDTNIALTGTTLNIEVGGETFIESQGDRLKFHTNITASGNVSSSGNITANNFLGDTFAADATADAYIQLSKSLTKISFVQGGTTGLDINHNSININRNITASGTISASGMIQTAGAISSSTGITASDAFFSGNITASGTISASGAITGDVGQFSQIKIDGEVALDTGDSATTGRVFLDSQITKIQIGKAGAATQTVIEGNITASGNISSSLGNVVAGGGYYTPTSRFIDVSANNAAIQKSDGGSLDTLQLKATETQVASFKASSHITASGNISASSGITASNAIFSGNITASGTISASGMIQTAGAISSSTGVTASDAFFSGHVTASKLSIESDIVHTGDTNTKISFSAADRIDIQTGGAVIARVTDAGFNFNSGHITASGNISASSATSILTIPRRHLDQTVQGSVTNSTGSLAQGDIYYSQASVATVPGKIYVMQTNGNYSLTDKDAESSAASLIGVAIGTNSSTDGLLLRGMVKLHTNPFPGEGALGNPAYLGDDGLATGSIAGHASDDFIRIIGYGISGSGTIYFDPDKTFIKKS